MAKAHITTTGGIDIRVQGTPQEITAIVQSLRSHEAGHAATARPVRRASGRVSLIDMIASLADGSFFKQPKDLASIKAALAEMGHGYPLTTLSPVMLRLVRRRILRRIKENKRWVYTH